MILSRPAGGFKVDCFVAWLCGAGYLGGLISLVVSLLLTSHSDLWALWLGNIGHVAVTVFAMGWHDTQAVRNWNAVVWGNIGATVFLFLTRTAYFAGVFGKAPRSFSPESRKTL